MVYLIQVIVYTALMYMIYILILRNRPMHGFNRVYLLASVMLPFILPFVQLQNEAAVPLQQVAIKGIRLPEFVVNAGQPQATGFMFGIVTILYVLVAITILAVSVLQWHRLRRLAYKHPKEQREGYTIVLNTGYDPGSWYKYIFLPTAEKNETIISHEIAHIRLHHTVDLMLLTLVQVCFWPNLFLVLIRKELAQVHEFQADAATGVEKEAYSTLLLSNLFGTCILPSTHSFIIHPLKRRIMMLNKKSKTLPRIAALLATGVAVTVLMVNIVSLQSCKSKQWDAKNENEAATTELNAMKKDVAFAEGEVYKVVDKMPEFPGDIAAFMGEHIKYPKEAEAQKLEGKVMVSFVVDKDGNVVNAKVLRSPDELLSAAALKMVDEMPEWTPGETAEGKKVAVEFKLPVMFKL